MWVSSGSKKNAPAIASAFFGGGGWIRPPAGGPGRGSGAPPAPHSLPLPSNPPFPGIKPRNLSIWTGSWVWWGRVDSNHRRHSQQIYSLSPLATREHPRVVAASSGSSRFRPRPKARSLRCGSASNRTRFAGLRFDVEEFNCIESPSAIRGAGGRT